MDLESAMFEDIVLLGQWLEDSIAALFLVIS